MNQMVRFGVILAVICFTATLVLAVTHQITEPRILQQLETEEQQALKEVLPEADSFEAKKIDGIEYFEATENNRLIGYCLKITGSGYGGFIRMMAGINPEGAIEGVRILEQYETPGLGARINEVRQGEKDPWFLRQFKGKRADSVEVKKNIDAITGATISSRAVTDALNKNVTEFLSKVSK